MQRFLIRRAITSLVSVFGATIVVFTLIHLGPDPRLLFVPDSGYGMSEAQWQQLGDKLGFNDPAPIQYLNWVGRIVRGDLGVSLAQTRPVSEIIGRKIGATIQLAIGGWIFAVLLGVTMGVVAAVKRGTVWDYIARGLAVIGIGAPAFVTGLFLILIFAVKLQWLPAATRPADFDIRFYILPCIALGWPAAAGLMRLVRTSMLDVLDSEYIKLARAKGVSARSVIWKHALRNSMVAPLTSMLIIFANWLNGALVIEVIFAWPGIGFTALFTAVNNNDFPVLLGTVFVFIMLFLAFSFLADMVYMIVDPRVRLGESAS
jgi:peptide/nickel transport system permease protein